MHVAGRRTAVTVASLIMVTTVLGVALVFLLRGRPIRVDALPEQLEWTVGEPLVSPRGPYDAIKDPSIVRYEDTWHLFYTLKGPGVGGRIGYTRFADWGQADSSPRYVLPLWDGYTAAPQVFYFAPYWYLIYQIWDSTWRPSQQPAYSRTTDLLDPTSWSEPTRLYPEPDTGVEGWLDFWVIFDSARAHLFFTTMDERVWRAETSADRFPGGWSRPLVAFQGEAFEASHTYSLAGTGKYLTIVEARQPGDRRYHNAYVADRLDGPWSRWLNGRRRPFAGAMNVRRLGQGWAESVSHGELVRSGYDQTLEVDPAHLKLLFQGLPMEVEPGTDYDDLPWRLGLLQVVPSG